MFTGLSITANNSQYSFDCGYGGFFNLRKNVALAFDEELGKHYSSMSACIYDEDYKMFDAKTNNILADPRFSDADNDVLDFLFASDCDGSISYRTAKKIANLLSANYQQLDLGKKIFTYGAHSDGKDYQHFIDFLNDCYSHRRKVFWY